MGQNLLLQTNFRTIGLLKSDFHKINQLINSKDKIFEINICSKSFFFSKEQIVLFSVDAYLQIIENKQPFCLMSSDDFSDSQFISCFNEIFFLFSTSNEIQIDSTNVLPFQHLAHKFNNSILLSNCNKFIQTNQTQTFFLSPESFSLIPIDILNSLNNFKIILSTEAIDCNFLFASLISNKISRQISTDKIFDCIDFSSHQFPEMIKLFFNILQGTIIQVDENNVVQILKTIDYLETDILSVQNFLKNHSSNFASANIMAIFFLPIECIRTLFSFPYLHLKNEDQLFELILNKIQDQRKFLFLLNYASLGNIDSFFLNYLIQSIQLTELTESSFDHFKNSLFSNYLISVDNENREDNIQSLLFSSKILKIFS
jgi:hypothetical protein